METEYRPKNFYKVPMVRSRKTPTFVGEHYYLTDRWCENEVRLEVVGKLGDKVIGRVTDASVDKALMGKLVEMVGYDIY